MHTPSTSLQIRLDKKFILSDNGREFSSASMAYIAAQLGFTKVYTSAYLPCSNSVIERRHNFFKKLNQEIEMQSWNRLWPIRTYCCDGL